MNLPDGTLLQGGKYKIVRFIGSGGFGCTYEAEHVMLEKRVAVKEFFVKDLCNRDEGGLGVTVGVAGKEGLAGRLRRKFVDEARALCRLRHRGIVSVSDVFEENGTAYYVMDYIEGRSLGDIVDRRGPLPEEEALGYIRQVAEALQYVHGRKRLHLDVKPGNIMVDGQGNAVLIDFGASKQYGEANGENTSALMGKTPGYAPLEQMGNDVAEFLPATDVYALGATLYKLLAGVAPLSASRLASGEALAPLPETVSMPVREAVRAAMEIDKRRRTQSVGEFMRALEAGKAEEAEETVIGSGSGDGPGPPPPKGRKWVPFAVAAAVLIGATGGFAAFEKFKETSRRQQEEPTRLDSIRIADSIAVVEAVYDWIEPFSEGMAAVKLNGKWGYVDETGREVIPLQYDWARPFSEGLASVDLNGNWGHVDKAGREAVQLKYDCTYGFKEGLARVLLNGKWGYIDKTGREVIPLQYDNAKPFSEGKAEVKLNGTYFYIDKNGNRVY